VVAPVDEPEPAPAPVEATPIEEEAKSMVPLIIGIVAALVVVNIIIVVLYLRHKKNNLQQIQDAELVDEKEDYQITVAADPSKGDDLKEDGNKYSKVNYDSQSIDLKKEDDTNMMIMASPDKVLTPDKLKVNQEPAEVDTISKLFLDHPIDIDAKGEGPEKITEEEAEHATP
jgi:hypothetical protein